jgi:hypothetical protein
MSIIYPNDIMPLWIHPLFGDPIEVSFSLVQLPYGWRNVYYHLYYRYYSDKPVHCLRLFHGESMDLSGVQDGDHLRLLVTDPMAERWVSEYRVGTHRPIHCSMMTWYDDKWGDPYETPAILYRTPLTAYLFALENSDHMLFRISPESIPPYEEKDRWYPTLREAGQSFREALQCEGIAHCSEKTVEHFIHLWELYHGTLQHHVNQGRYYDY